MAQRASVQWTTKQREAAALMSGPAMHCMLFGGSRSGKTFKIVRRIILRALKAPNSRHAIFRFRFNHAKASLALDTIPAVMAACFPGIPCDFDKTDWFLRLPNGSQVWISGLDDKDRTEKILGQEFATLYFNECSQIPWASVLMALTRLSQKVDQEIWDKGATEPRRKPLALKAFYDCNPPSKAHWTYLLFIRKVDPESRRELPHPDNYVSMRINPIDNLDNLGSGYMDTLASMSARMRGRFLDGKFADATPGQLFPDEYIDRYRVIDGNLPQFSRVVIAVDPSGSDDVDNEGNDPIGVVAAGLGYDGICYILEDATLLAGPATWGRMAITLHDKHEADCIVGESNYGGAMVGHVIKTAAAHIAHRAIHYKVVTASRGKHVRAEPISALYEQGKVRHVGYLRPLEDELAAFNQSGYTGTKSPNRADAAIWAISELFGGIVQPQKKKVIPSVQAFQPRDAGCGLM